MGSSSAREQEDRRIAPATIDAPGCRELLAQFDRAGVEVALFDMTCDSGVSVFRAVIADAVLDPERPRPPSTGTGCHPSRDIALSRALTEAAQSRLTMIAGSRDDLPRERYSADGDLERLRSRRDGVFRGDAGRSFQDAPTFEAEDIGDDIVRQKERLLAIGIAHVVVVDLTKAEVGIPVVRVLIPELEPPSDLPGWLPGRRAKARQARTTFVSAAIHIFAGPSLPAGARPTLADVVFLRDPPSKAYSFTPSPGAGGVCAIGLIDGYFERMPAVWHKEILWALSEGVHVFGAASMGALRAAELAAFGMVGVGRVYADFACGQLTDDDEVTLVHADADQAYRPLSEAMVNIRATLAAAERGGVLSPEQAATLIATTKQLFYPERSFPALLETAKRVICLTNNGSSFPSG